MDDIQSCDLDIKIDSMKYIDVLFISSMEYNIYFYWPTT